MQYQDYSNDINKYDLSQGYSLQQAKTNIFTKSWVVYRNVSEDFSQSFTEIQTDLAGVDFCFWIMWNDIRIGGAVMLPNGTGDFFLIPPEKDEKKCFRS